MEAISYLFDRALPYWKEWYTDEENFLKNRVPTIERISHIGSTAISSIYAKPIWIAALAAGLLILLFRMKNSRDFSEQIAETVKARGCTALGIALILLSLVYRSGNTAHA